jgi:hypothetical protein
MFENLRIRTPKTPDEIKPYITKETSDLQLTTGYYIGRTIADGSFTLNRGLRGERATLPAYTLFHFQNTYLTEENQHVAGVGHPDETVWFAHDLASDEETSTIDLRAQGLYKLLNGHDWQATQEIEAALEAQRAAEARVVDAFMCEDFIA